MASELLLINGFNYFLRKTTIYSHEKDSHQYISHQEIITKNNRVPQSFALRLLLFIIYLSDMYSSVKICKIYHYTDDTSLLLRNSSLKKKINRLTAMTFLQYVTD